MRRLALGVTLALALTGCAKARHVSVVADQTLATAVFAVDDGERALCQAQVLTAPTCERLGVTILHALQGVRVATVTIQAAKPDALVVPTDLLAVLTDLQAVQATLVPLQVDPNVGPVVAKVNAAIATAARVVATLAGGAQ